MTMDAESQGIDRVRTVRHRDLKVDASMRALSVVVADVLAKDPFEMTMAKNEAPVEAFGPDGSHPALRVGDRTGVRIVSVPIEANTSSKLAVNFVSLSRMRNLKDRLRSTKSSARLRATCVTNASVGWSVTPSDVDLSCR